MFAKLSRRGMLLCGAAMIGAGCSDSVVGAAGDSQPSGTEIAAEAGDMSDDARTPDRSAIEAGNARKAAAAGEAPSAAGSESAEAAEPVSGLPWAGNRSFRTLDDYLAYLDKASAIGLPHYEEIEPGVYLLVPGKMTGAPQNEPITREALAEKLGFPG